MREKKEVFKAFRYGLDLAGKIKKSPPEEVISCWDWKEEGKVGKEGWGKRSEALKTEEGQPEQSPVGGP